MQRLSYLYITREHNQRFTFCMAFVIASCMQWGFIPLTFTSNLAYAQGTAQVVLTGIPPVLPSPYISDLERGYEQGLFTTQFIYVSPSRQPQTFRFNLTLEVNGETLIDVTSEPNQYAPGIHLYRTFDDEPAINFPLGYADIIQQLDAGVEQTGLLPEGDYVLSIKPVVEDELTLIPSVAGIAFFSIRYADPPLLLTPFDQSNLTTQFPVFSWTPVVGAPLTSIFEYEFILVEVFPGQAPYQAIESNIALVQEGMVGQTSFVYTLGELPLEEGKTYAWQVQAHDVNEQMPVLDRGETDFHTFTVGKDGQGSMLASWSFPVSSPFLMYKFDDGADLDPSDTEIFIDGNLPIELLGLSSEANFEKLLIDAETQSIIEGFLTIPEPVALEVTINSLSDDLSGYSAVSSGSSLNLSDGLLLELGTHVKVDAAGLHPAGTHKAIVSYTGLPNSEWTATYSNTFTFGFAPFHISKGRVDFAADGVARAYADASGFHLIDQSDPVIAQIPDRLQLPDDDVAFIALKSAGVSLVDIEPVARGQFSVREKSGTTLELTLPGLNRTLQQEEPHYIASLEDVVIDAKTGQLISGKITARTAGDAAHYTLDALGIPIAPTSFTTRNTEEGVRLDIEGQLTLFGKAVQNTEPILLSMNEAGVVEGEIFIQDSNAYLFLDGEAGNISLDLDSAEGMVRVPLNAYTSSSVGIEVTGQFNINKGDNVVAATDVSFTYAGEGPVKFQHFSPIKTERTSRSISLNSFGLQIDEITSLDFFYTHAAGLKYVADLQAGLLPFNGTSSTILPLSGVELHQNKFYIPAQEAHAGTASFASFSRKVGAATLNLLAYRMPTALVSRKSEQGPEHLSPYFDFEVHLDGVPSMPERFAQLPITLQDARIEDGIVTGNMIPYSLEHQEIPLPMAAGTFNTNIISGHFGAAEGKQEVQIYAEGTFNLSTSITDEFKDCAVPGVTLTLDAAGSVNGSSMPFEPCTTFSIGPVAASFEEATLQITSDKTTTLFALDGMVDAFSRPGSRRTSSASGPLLLDIVTGNVIEADVDVEKLFWEFPIAAPQFQISADQTHLSTEGFLLANDSTVAITDITSANAYVLKSQNDFRLGLNPSLANAGQADLFIADDLNKRVAHFDSDGFHPSVVSEALPQRIVLPGGFGAYIDILQAGDDVLKLGKTGKAGRSIQTNDGQTAQLVIPQLVFPQRGTSPRGIELPVSFELDLNRALKYASGSFEHDLSSRPVKLFAGNSPVNITHVRYDGSKEQILLTGTVEAPASLADPEVSSNLDIEAVFVLNASGLSTTSVKSDPFLLYNNTLSINIDGIHMQSRGNGLSLQLDGRVDSPLFRHKTVASPPLRFNALYNAGAQTWSLETITPESQKIAIDQATLFLDPANPPIIKADPTLVLEMTGALALPASISTDFMTEVAMEIGPGGIYVWQMGNLDDPQPFFNGFLTAHLDALDIFYDAENQTLVTTIDGAFAPGIVTQQTNSTFDNGPSDLLPFSGIELSTNGTVALRSTRFGRNTPDSTDFIRLLADLPRMPVISQSFWIEELILSTPGKGLSLEIEGTVRLPTSNGRRIRVGESTNEETPSVVYSDRVPVSITLDSHGQTFDKSGNPWQPLLIDRNTATDLETQPAGFEITSVYLHFNPLVAEDNRILTTSRVHLPISNGQAVADSTTASALDGSFAAKSLAAESFISLGSAFSAKQHPGLIIDQQRPQQYLVSDITTVDQPALSISSEFFDTDITSISLPNPEVLQLELGGISQLKTKDIQGFFPVEGITLTPNGLQDYGQSAGPSAFTFLEAGLFEVGCVDFGPINRTAANGGFSGQSSVGVLPAQTFTPRRSLSRVQFGSICGDDLSLTLTDKYLSGSFGNFIFRKNTNSPAEAQITNTQIDLAGLATLSANITYKNTLSPPSLQVDGTTTYRDIKLASTGAIKHQDGQTNLGIIFSPARQSLTLLDDAVQAAISGGGFFLNPSDADIELVNLVLNERSNNSFSSNKPDFQRIKDNQLGMLLPLEASFYNRDSLALQGTGLMTVDEHFTTLDLDGAFLGRPNELSTGLFIVEQNHPDATRSLEGLANISLNYTAVAGGIVKANFVARPAADKTLDWSVYGRSDIDFADTARLPGQFLLAQDGLVIELYNTTSLKTAQLSLNNDLNLTLWSDKNLSTLSGYSTFEAEFDLIPDFSLASVKMYGGIIQDRDEPLFYAARNMFADVPFVYTGPIDPWLSLQDGAIYGGDARNTTFRRMIADARQYGNAVPVHATDAIAALRNALDVQRSLAFNLIQSGNLPYFALSDSLLVEAGKNLLSLEQSFVGQDKLPAIFNTLSDALYNDEDHPDYRRYRNIAASNPQTLVALQAMTTGVDRARKTAESDIFTLSGLLPRPLLWNADYVDLVQELSTSPVNKISWPGETDTDQPGFTIDYNLQSIHNGSLLNFKQINEGLDVQFLRTIGGLELNMVNLKIARSPQQAIDFSAATSNISKYYAMHIAGDWEMLGWSKAKTGWLQKQEDAIERGIRNNLRAYNNAENSLDAIRSITQQRHDQARQLAKNTSWKREDLPEDQRFSQYLSSLDEPALKDEFAITAKNLWFDVPMAALSSLSDTLSSLIKIRNERFESGVDTLNKAYGAFSLALDPLYDIQTRFTTTLYGMAEEYRTWRSSIRRLDPDAVNYAFQFLPYRGNYRILADDLIPPTIEDIRITPSTNRFLNNTTITWSADHPVELVETSLALSFNASSTPHFASISQAPEFQFFTVKPDQQTTSRDVNVTLRVRGAGGIPAVKNGQFSVSVDPDSDVVQSLLDTPLIPADTSPPQKPQIHNLHYSSYFSDTPNILKFELGAINDEESGLDHIEYRIVNDRDEREILQDWTQLQKSTSYFAGRLIETSLPVQEEDLSVRVTVRAHNEAGLTSETSESLSLKLDDSEPAASITNATYYNAFHILHPYSIELELGEITDAESGIDLIEYALQQGGQASLANANWKELRSFPDRNTNVGRTSVFVDLQNEILSESRAVVTLYLRITNGAGLQTIVNRTIEIPGRDLTPPSEPLVTLEHSGFYGPENDNTLRIIAAGSRDFESGISSVEYRVIDGKTGFEISGWEDFVFLDPNSPTFILPAIEKVVALPAFASSRTIIVETRTTNAAGIQSNKGVRFIQLDLDDTQPTEPALTVQFNETDLHDNQPSILIEVGPSQDLESLISKVSYRVVNLSNQQPLMNWRSIVNLEQANAQFPGATALIDVSGIPAGSMPGVQVRVTNQQGLHTVVSRNLNLSSDLTPPTQPSLLLAISPEESNATSKLTIYLGPGQDPESGLAGARYRIRDLQQADSSIVAWTNIALSTTGSFFKGKTINTTVPALNKRSVYLVDTELINKAGLSTRVSGIVDQTTQAAYLKNAPALPDVHLFYFDADNSIRQNELEVRVTPNTSFHTAIDSVYYRFTVFDRQQEEIKGRNRSVWRALVYRAQKSNQPLVTYLPLPASEDQVSARVEIQLVNSNGASPVYQAYVNLALSGDATAPTPPVLDYVYSGYHGDTPANQLSLSLNNINDPESRITQVSYRIVDNQNPSDVIVDWTDISSIDDTGLYQPANVSLALPEFSRSRQLRIEAKASNGAGLSSAADTLLAISVDRTPPDIADPELVISGANNADLEPQLSIFLGSLSDMESKITSVAYRVFANDDTDATLIDWTSLELIKNHTLRFPAITASLSSEELSNTFTVELEAQNEAGLSANITSKVEADLDNSAPQMPRVEVSYRESELGTDYLLIEPGAFRDAESKIAALEYRLVDSNNPEFVLINWVPIPVPHDIRVSVAPIAIPRSEIPYDGAAELAAEFRATNGAGLFSVRRSTVDFPGDESPPESPSLIVAHRNAYDPLHPNTVEIQIGSSDDNQSAIAQAQYRITNASTGEEVASWTQLPISSEGYFPGTILFKELPLIQSSTSLIIEVEVLNTAGLVNTITQDVRVDVKNDATPPVTDISLHYFENDIALVLDKLSDQESKIQKVEYRFLDNVDQSEVMGWTELFEITIPQGVYPKQSFNIKQPSVRSGRTLKVEVRVTNGAGLQTTVSKTVLVRSPGSGQ